MVAFSSHLYVFQNFMATFRGPTCATRDVCTEGLRSACWSPPCSPPNGVANPSRATRNSLHSTFFLFAIHRARHGKRRQIQAVPCDETGPRLGNQGHDQKHGTDHNERQMLLRYVDGLDRKCRKCANRQQADKDNVSRTHQR